VKAVAFDLDMTLVDSRPCSERALHEMVARHRHDLDVEALMASYGLPLAQWLPPGTDHQLFRALQHESLPQVKSMPGAREALDSVRAAGARVVVITAAPAPIADAMLDLLDLAADALHAEVWASGKVAPLRSESCEIFVGDHPDDMQAARGAGAIAVGEATGVTPPLGADVVLDDLTHFPSWLAGAPNNA
jgi:phosphoglycolate phosphatase